MPAQSSAAPLTAAVPAYTPPDLIAVNQQTNLVFLEPQTPANASAAMRGLSSPTGRTAQKRKAGAIPEWPTLQQAATMKNPSRFNPARQSKPTTDDNAVEADPAPRKETHLLAEQPPRQKIAPTVAINSDPHIILKGKQAVAEVSDLIRGTGKIPDDFRGIITVGGRPSRPAMSFEDIRRNCGR